jgi:hypothetical protein
LEASSVVLWIGALCTLLAAGCVQQKIEPGRPKNSVAANVTALDSFYDPCAKHLEDISGALLLYYTKNHHWPATLSELAPITGEQLALTCPASNQPYIYNLGGLEGPDDQRRLIVYDATPAHSNARWGIVLGKDIHGGNPTFEVIAIPEVSFRLYHPAPPKPQPTFPQRPSQAGQPPVYGP